MFKGFHFAVLQRFKFCVPGGARTHDPLIKSQLLYQLSYRNFSQEKELHYLSACGHKNSINICIEQQKIVFFKILKTFRVPCLAVTNIF